MIYLRGNVRHQMDLIRMIINSQLLYLLKLPLVIFKKFFSDRIGKKEVLSIIAIDTIISRA